jgi:CheY-like chemotaxis protein
MKLPWKPGDPPALEEGAALADLWWPYAAGRKVLVIEEHLPYLHYLETLLRRAGYQVISATQAAEAVQKAREEQPDVIVIDRKLPALRRFRMLGQLGEPTTSQIPVVMVALRNPGNFMWRDGDESVAYISRDPDCLIEILRRLDLRDLHRREAAQAARIDSIHQGADISFRQEQPQRILVADDERHVVRFVETHLRAAGYEVISCFDGRELLERAKRERPDAIVMDLIMPFIGHWLQVFSAVRTDPLTADLPFVLVSPKSPSVSPSLWIPPSGSVAAFLAKPFSSTELLTAVSSALGSKCAEPPLRP